MAYFSNGTEGMSFDHECSTCKYGESTCPIAWAQMEYNYDAVNNEVATKILDVLVKDDGTCTMKKLIHEVTPSSELSLNDQMKMEIIEPNLWKVPIEEIENLFNKK